MKKILLLFVTLLTLVQGTWAANYITDVMVVGADDDDEAEAYYDYYTSQGWSGIFKDLNNNGGGHYIYLLYKTNNSRGSSGKAINNLYLWVSEHDNAPNSFVHNGRTYYLAGYDGDGTFKAKRGDLNCGAGGYWIRLFYTKDDGEYACVTNLSIDNSKGGALGENGGYTPCDLNKDAGGDDIFMHISRSLATNNPDVYTGRQLQEVAPFGYVNVRMMADIKLNDVVYFAQGDCSLDLNGHTLDRGLKEPIATGSVIEVSSSCQLTIKDSSADHSGVITGGACSGYGGGISNEGTLTITGGTITGNTAMRYGGGIWTRAESLFGIVSAGTLNIQGNVVVSGNTADGFPNDVYLDDGQKINVTGPLTEGARIGVTTDEPDATITSGYATHNGGTDPSRFFFSNSDYKLSLNGSGEVVQSAPADNWIDYRAAEFNHVDGRNIFIESEEELALLAYNVNNGNGYYNFFINLTKDLDMSAHQWTPIGTEQNKFRGCFDGRGHTINGIYVNTNSDNAGFFGYMLGVEPGWPYSRFRYIRNVNLTKANIIGGNNVGGILGFAHSQIRLDNIYCEANVIGLNNVGGFIGQSYQDPKSNGGSWIAYGVCNSLFKGGVIRGTGNRGTTIGTRGQYFFISQTYYAHPGSKTDDSYDNRAYPVYVAERKGIVVQYDTLDAGVFFNDTAYYPAGTATFTLENDANHRITSVKVNGSEVGTTTGKYQITVDPAKAVAYVISVATKPATDLAGNGTAADPYLITSADDWNRVANLLRVGGL